jgi:hypothetical protein
LDTVDDGSCEGRLELSNVIDDLLVNAQEQARAIALREHVLRKLNQLVLDLSQNGALVEVSAEAELRITLQVLLPVNGAAITPVGATGSAAAYDPLRPAAVVVPPPAPETATAGKVTGPFSAAEKAIMDRLSGSSAAEIARDMNRSVQSVALYLNGQKYAKDKVRAQVQPEAAAPGVPPPRFWTAADDDWLVDAIAANRITGQRTYRDMMEHAASTLGRGLAATTARSTALRNRIMARAGEFRPLARPADAPPRAPTAAEAVAAPEPDPELVRAVTEAVVPPAPPFDPGVPVWRREIEDRLNRLGNAAPFTPKVDLALLEGLAKGHKLGWISTDLGIDFDALKTRFRQLVPEPGIVAQDRVGAVLRARATAD